MDRAQLAVIATLAAMPGCSCTMRFERVELPGFSLDLPKGKARFRPRRGYAEGSIGIEATWPAVMYQAIALTPDQATADAVERAVVKGTCLLSGAPRQAWPDPPDEAE